MGSDFSSEKAVCFKKKAVKTPIVLLTSPHSKCDDKFGVRMCDTNAGSARESLATSLREQGFIVKEEEADMFRFQIDLNRFPSRNSGFRSRIREFVQSNYENIIFVLDIHSFPRGYMGFGPFTTLAILDDSVYLSSQTSAFCPESTALDAKLRQNGIYSNVIEGSINDIQNEMRSDFNLPSLLLEYREDLDKSMLNSINKVISQWLAEQNS